MDLILSCEHGGNRIPAAYRYHFLGRETLLASHRGWDPGALDAARTAARYLDAPLHHATVSRLLADLNRSVGNRSLFSEVTRSLPPQTKERILRDHYYPYRQRLASAIEQRVTRRRSVLHVSYHTFTPLLRGVRRRADVGLLFDPDRPRERALCARWRDALGPRLPEMRIYFNSPYHGSADGLTTALRRRFPRRGYLGIELEVNSRHRRGGRKGWLRIARALARSLAEVR